MKKRIRSIFGLIKGPLVLALSSSSVIHAQMELSDENAIFELSPFVVDSSGDTGYRATTTLAGSRLNMQLKDVGSAVSVMTEEFMNDTGATDAGTLLSYGLNTEVSGDQGNFGNVVGSFGNTAGGSGTRDTRSLPQASQRVRGLASATLTRDYFLTDIPFDSYNTDSVTINRGPNSLLFGVGSPGGVIDNSLSKAAIGRDFGEVNIRNGERGSYRVGFDYNKNLIEERLAIRFSLMEGDTQFQQRPAYQKDSRQYAALHAILAKNENVEWLGATNLRANFENGIIEGAPVNHMPLSDGISHWFELPDNLAQISAISGRAPDAWEQNYQGKWTGDTADGGDGQGLSLTHGPVGFAYWEQIPIIYNDPLSTVPSIGLPGSPEIDGVQARVSWNRSSGDPGWGRTDMATSGNYFDYRGPLGFVYPNVNNPNIYDNRRLLLTGTKQFLKQDFDVANIKLEQTFFNDKLGLEFAYNKENNLRYDHFPFQRSALVVDIMERLPSGHENPNLGRPMIVDNGTMDERAFETNREAYQATAFYKLNFSESEGWGRWFGDHVLTGFVSSQTIDNRSQIHRTVFEDSTSSTDIASIVNQSQKNAGRRNVPTQVYVGQSLLDAQSVNDVQLNEYIRANTLQDGEIYTTLYNTQVPVFNPDYATDPNGRLLRGDFVAQRILSDGDRSRQKIESDVVSIQSNWLKDHVVTVFGWRGDKLTDTSRVTDGVYDSAAGTTRFRYSDGQLDPGSLILGGLPGDSSTQMGDTAAASIVAHVPDRWVEWLPFNTGVSFHYNESENFSASGVRRNVYGEELSAPTGETTDYGFALHTLGNKLNFRFNWYETTSLFATASLNADAPGWISQAMSRWKGAERAMSWTEVMALNTKLTGIDATAKFPNEWQGVYDAYLALMPQPVQDRFDGFDAGGNATWKPNPGQSATQSFVSKGFELDVVGNVTENWTVAFNMAEQETITSKTAPAYSDFVFTVADNMKTSPLGTMIDSPSTGEAEQLNTRWDRHHVLAVAAALSKDGQVSLEQRKWRWNLVSNYTFSEGILKRFQIGGGLRWQDRIATGYEIEVDNGRIIPNLAAPLYGDTELNGDLWVKYGRPILNDKVNWLIQLNVRNLYRSNTDFITVVTNPDGRDAVFRNPNPKEVFLSNSFKF